MRIISNFQDYYDAIQQYGVDNKIVFNRINENVLKFNTEANSWLLSYMQSEISREHMPRLNLKIENFQEDFKKIEELSYLINESYYFPFQLKKAVAVINSKAYVNYILIKKESNAIIDKNVTVEKLFNLLRDNRSHLEAYESQYYFKKFFAYKNFSDFMDAKTKSYYKEKEVDSFTSKEVLDKLHKKLDNPIFFIMDDGYVLKNVPLAYLGFNKLFNGNIEVMAQEISYCLGNVIHNNNEPPVAISDVVKLEQHGFDKKQSFRHRK